MQTLKADGGFALGGTLPDCAFSSPHFISMRENSAQEYSFTLNILATGRRDTYLTRSWRSPYQGQLDSSIWQSHEYEYERNRLPIDVITGGPRLREWVDNPHASIDSLCSWIEEDRSTWFRARENYCLYQTPQLEPLVIGPHR